MATGGLVDTGGGTAGLGDWPLPGGGGTVAADGFGRLEEAALGGAWGFFSAAASGAGAVAPLVGGAAGAETGSVMEGPGVEVLEEVALESAPDEDASSAAAAAAAAAARGAASAFTLASSSILTISSSLRTSPVAGLISSGWAAATWNRIPLC